MQCLLLQARLNLHKALLFLRWSREYVLVFIVYIFIAATVRSMNYTFQAAAI